MASPIPRHGQFVDAEGLPVEPRIGEYRQYLVILIYGGSPYRHRTQRGALDQSLLECPAGRPLGTEGTGVTSDD